MPGEFAIHETETRDRAAETVVARALKVETGLEHHAAQCGANRRASELKRVGREMRIADSAGSLDLNRPGNRAIGIDAALPSSAFKARVAECLADDELASLIGAHLAGYRRYRGQQAGRQCNATQHSPYSRSRNSLLNIQSIFLTLTDYTQLYSQ